MIGPKDWFQKVAEGKVPGYSKINKFGENPEVTTATDPEDIWDGGGIYMFYPTAAEAISTVSTDVDDTGVVLSSGTATGGSITTLIDTGADFVSDGVAIGDVLINDSTGELGVITVVAATQVTIFLAMSNRSEEGSKSTANSSGDIYRIANANDTGAAVVHYQGLDSNWRVQTETVVMNGTSAVNLTKTYIRMHRAEVIIAGSSGGAEGLITASGGTGAACIINNGNNQTEMCVYTVPEGKIGYFLGGYVTVARGVTSGAFCDFTWRARPFGGVFSVKSRVTCVTTGNSSWSYKYPIGVGVPARTDVLIRAEEVSATMGLSGGFTMLLKDINI